MLPWAIPLVGLFALWAWTSRRTANPTNRADSGFTRSRARVNRGDQADRPDTTFADFADFAGYDGVKEEICEVVERRSTNSEPVRRLLSSSCQQFLESDLATFRVLLEAEA